MSGELISSPLASKFESVWVTGSELREQEWQVAKYVLCRATSRALSKEGGVQMLLLAKAVTEVSRFRNRRTKLARLAARFPAAP
jgi:hypothetical protein